MPSQPVDVAFPLGGLNRRYGLQNQPPYTTPDCLNVRPVTGSDRRMRGGTRPGLSKILATQFGVSGSDRPFGFITSVAAINDNRGIYDPFDGTSLNADWTVLFGYAPTVTGGELRTPTGGTFFIGRTVDIPATSLVHSAEIECKALEQTRYAITLRYSAAGSVTVAIEFDPGYAGSKGFQIHFYDTIAGVTTLRSSTPYVDTVATDSEFKVEATGAGYAEVNIYWRDTLLQTSDATASVGSGVGIRIQAQDTVGTQIAKIYGATLTWVNPNDRVRNLWACQGAIYVEREGIVRGWLSQYVSNSRWVAITQYRGNLYSYLGLGDTGWIYDYVKDYPVAWTATAGTLPHAMILATWGGRIVACERHIFSMSRVNDPLDWNYAASESDLGRAIAYTAGETAAIGEWGTAIIPASGDVCFLAKSRSIWALLGNPAGGGQLINTSRSTGILNPHAWTRTADDTIYFLGYDGLYRLAKGQTQNPEKMLGDKVPALRPDPDTETGTLVYDHYAEGIHIFNVEIDNVVYDFFYHIPTDSLWPVEMPSTMRMRSIGGVCSVDTINTAGSRVWIGCKDGYLRRLDEAASNDDGTAIASNVLMGPIRLAPSLWEGRVDELRGVMAASSGNVTWSVQSGRSGELAIAASAQASGTWAAGENRTSRPRVSGQYACVKLSAASGRWSMEEMTMVRSGAGRTR